MRGEADRQLVAAALLVAASSSSTARVVVLVALLVAVRLGSYTAWLAAVALTGLATALHGLAAAAPGTALLASPRAAGTLAVLSGAALLLLVTPPVRRQVGAEPACPER